MPTINYTWQNVAMGGGGFVTGIVLSPHTQNLGYIWTDVGGIYRHNPNDAKWEPMCDRFTRSQQTFYGGISVAIDPSNSNVVYKACGKYKDWSPSGDIFKSIDGGATWTKLNVNTNGLKMDSNDVERWAAQRLAINPSNTSVVLFGSGHDGIWKTTNGGTSWTKKTFTATLTAKIGVLGIKFHPSTTDLVYAIAYGDGVYVSTDAGENWTKMTGSPTQAQQIAFGDTYMLVTHKSGIAKYSGGTWSDVTPEAGAFNAVAISPNDPTLAIATRGQRTDTKVFISTNSGANWSKINHNVVDNIAWWDAGMCSVWTSQLAFDPFAQNKVWMTNGFGVYTTDNITANPIVWTCHTDGIEEIVAFNVVAPSGTLVSAVGDVDGFYHSSLTNYPSARHDGYNVGDTGRASLDIDFCFSQPQYMVRCGGQMWNTTNGYRVAKSSNGGSSWTAVTWDNTKMPVRVAISCTNPDLFLIITSQGQTYRTTDGGATFSAIASLPNTNQGGPWNWNRFLAADKVDGNTFYWWDAGKVYKSTDGGATFSLINSSVPYSQWTFKVLKTAPNGDVWFSGGDQGLYKSTDGGVTFNKLTNVYHNPYIFCIGPKLDPSDAYSVYVYGNVNGTNGIYRSRNGVNWDLISITSQPVGNEPNCFEPDWSNPGKVFIGTNGRGIFVGQPV